MLPGGQRTRSPAIDTYDGEVDAAFPTMSVTLRLDDEIDVSRGDMIVEAEDQPVAARELEAMVCWMGEEPLRPRGRYAIKHTTRTARAIVEELEHRVDVNTLEHEPADRARAQRDRPRPAALQLAADGRPLPRNRTTGSFILIDEATNDTVGAGMVLGAR